MVWRYDRISRPSTATIAIVTGITSEKATNPTTGTRTRRISSVA